MHFWPKFGNTDFNLWWLIARTSSKWGKFWLWSSRSIIPKNNRDLNQGLLHLWSKFGDSSLNGWWVTARTSWWLTDRHTHTHTHAGNVNTRRPKLASGKKQDLGWCYWHHSNSQFYIHIQDSKQDIQHYWVRWHLKSPASGLFTQPFINQSSASLAFVWGIHRGPVNSPHKWPVRRKMFPFDDVIMTTFINSHTSTDIQPCQKMHMHVCLLQMCTLTSHAKCLYTHTIHC